MLPSASRLRVDAGWTWIEPDRRALVVTHGAASVVVSLLLVAGAATLTIPDWWVGVPLTGAVVATGLAVLRRTWRVTHARAGVSELGLAVMATTDAVHVAWPQVLAVTGRRRGRRVHLVVRSRQGDVAPLASFSHRTARRFLDECADVAARRRLDPHPAPGGLGFVAGDAVR